jgi:hypothetical protein
LEKLIDEASNLTPRGAWIAFSGACLAMYSDEKHIYSDITA